MTGNESPAAQFKTSRTEIDNVVARNNMSFLLDDLPSVLKKDDAAVMDWFAMYMGLLTNKSIREHGMWLVGNALEKAGYTRTEFDAKADRTAYGRYIIGETLADLKVPQYPPLALIKGMLNEYYGEAGQTVPVFKMTAARFGKYLAETVNAVQPQRR